MSYFAFYLLFYVFMKKFSIILACSFCILTICGCGWSKTCSVWGDYSEGGVKDGKRTSCYENGQMKEKWKYDDGVKDGKRTYYYWNGQVSSKWKYEDGSAEGKRIFYYENGQVKHKLNYKGWRLDGKQVSYDENGQVSSEQNYKNGVIVYE